jgi:hypothetical protein
MKMLCLFNRRVCSTFLFVVLSLALPGCSKKNTVVLDDSIFSSASSDLRENWKAAANFLSKENYLGAATNLLALFGKKQQLSAAQNEAVSQALEKLGNQAFEAANKGDKGATEAVLKMKAAGVGDRRGQ